MILRFGLFILKPYCLILHFPKNLSFLVDAIANLCKKVNFHLKYDILYDFIIYHHNKEIEEFRLKMLKIMKFDEKYANCNGVYM